jgi:hypothetical protein
MYEAEVEAYMLDDEIAQILSEDSGWLEAQWPECIRQAEEDNQTVTGDPVLASYARLTETEDGYLYIYKFNVPVA